jgi:hypothetical protein
MAVDFKMTHFKNGKFDYKNCNEVAAIRLIKKDRKAYLKP